MTGCSECDSLRARIADLEHSLQEARSTLAELHSDTTPHQPHETVQRDVRANTPKRAAPILSLPPELVQQIAKYLEIHVCKNLHSTTPVYVDRLSIKEIVSLQRTCRQMHYMLQPVITSFAKSNCKNIIVWAAWAPRTMTVETLLPGDKLLSHNITRSLAPVVSLLRDLEVPVVMDTHDSPLLYATSRGKMELVKVFAERVPLIHAAAGISTTEALSPDVIAAHQKAHALQEAVLLEPEHSTAEERLEIAKCLLESGADVNTNRHFVNKYASSREQREIMSTPLTIAVERDDFNMLKLLLDYGADVNIRHRIPTRTGARAMPTALQISCAKGNLTIFKALLAAGADISAPASDFLINRNLHAEYSGTALCVLAMNVHKSKRMDERIAMARMLIEKGAAVEPRECETEHPRYNWSNTPLFCAVCPPKHLVDVTAFGPLQMAKLLLEHGASSERVLLQEYKSEVEQAAREMLSLAKECMHVDLTTEEELLKDKLDARRIVLNWHYRMR